MEAPLHLLQPDPAAAVLALRAMKTVASASGAIGPAQRALMDAARQVVLKIDVDIDSLTPIDPATLAAAVPDGALRRQFVNGMMVLALADGLPQAATTAAVAAFAEALGVETAELRELQRLTEHQMLLFRLDFMRRGHIADIMRNQLDQHGILGLAKSVLGMRGLIEDRELAAKYRAWEKLPEDSLGNTVWRYYQANGFALPGEKNGFPEAGVYHDFSHVLAHYNTDVPGEIEVASFTAGYKQRRPFYVILFVVLTFSTGVNVRPIPGGAVVGALGEPGVAERMFAALERGGAVSVDLSDKWDYWPYVGLPLDEVRQRLQVPPLQG
jgi:hypothetical protein